QTGQAAARGVIPSPSLGEGEGEGSLARSNRYPIQGQLDDLALGRRAVDRLGHLHVLQPLVEVGADRAALADRSDELGLGLPAALLVLRDRNLLQLLLALLGASDVADVVGRQAHDQRSVRTVDLAAVRLRVVRRTGD